MYHLSAVVQIYTSVSAQSEPVCYLDTLFDIVSNSAGRVLFDACVYYTLTVFVVVRWWHKPDLAPRNTKYFIIGAVFVWLLAIVVVVPPLV